MSISEVLTENDERLIAKDIVVMLSQKGVSYAQAESILEIASNQIRDIPLSNLGEESKMLFTPTDSSGTKYSAESIGIPCPIIDHEKEIGLNPFRL